MGAKIWCGRRFWRERKGGREETGGPWEVQEWRWAAGSEGGNEVAVARWEQKNPQETGSDVTKDGGPGQTGSEAAAAGSDFGGRRARANRKQEVTSPTKVFLYI